MDIREFSNKLAEASKNMSEEERLALGKMFESVTKGMSTDGKTFDTPVSSGCAIASEGTEVPEGMTQRLYNLKQNFLKQVPSITTHRARVIEIGRASCREECRSRWSPYH